jgi:ABC-2 type transport system permease protein
MEACVMKSFTQTIKEEFKLIFSDVAIVLTIIGGVILYSFLYPQPYLNESVSELSVSVVNLDKSDVSRDIVFKLDSTPQVDVIRQDTSLKDAQDALVAGKIKGIILIPINFKRDLILQKSPTISVGADGSYFLIYGGILEATMKSVLSQSASVKILSRLKNGQALVEAKKTFAPFTLKTINLFNVQNSYIQYVIPAVFILILQQTMLIGLGILGGGVNERAKDGSLKNTNTLFVILSRLIIFCSLFFIHMLFYFGFSYEYYDVTHIAQMADLLSFGVLFLLASAFLGIFLGSIFSSREIATPAVLFSSLPLVFSAGFIWPREALPEFVQVLSDFFPSTVGIQGFLKLNQMGANLSLVSTQTIILLAQIIVYAFLGYYFINKKRKQFE